MLVLLVPLGLCGCYDGRDGVARAGGPIHPEAWDRPAVGIEFSDATKAAGIDFVHTHGGSGTHYYVETMSGGCAFLDFDGDDWLDIFLVQGAPARIPTRGGPRLARPRSIATTATAPSPT